MPITINGDGTVTGISAGGLPDGSISTADIADDAVTLAKLSTTGTPGAGNFLRGDNSWQAPISAGTPNVVTYSSQNVLHGTTTHLIAAIQSSSGTHGYSASTGIWTCPTAGLWLYAPTIYIYGSNDAVEMEIRVITAQIPGGQSGMYFPGDFKTTGSYAYEVTGNCALLFQATVGDTAYVSGYQNSGATWTADVVHNICRLGD